LTLTAGTDLKTGDHGLYLDENGKKGKPTSRAPNHLLQKVARVSKKGGRRDRSKGGGGTVCREFLCSQIKGSSKKGKRS